MKPVVPSWILVIALLALTALLVQCGDTSGVSDNPDGDLAEQDTPASTTCKSDADCLEGWSCHLGVCIDGPPSCQSSGDCGFDADCPAGDYCDDTCSCVPIGGGDTDGDEDMDLDFEPLPNDCESGAQLSTETELNFGFVQFDTDASKILHVVNLCDDSALSITNIEIISDSTEFVFVDPPSYPVVLADNDEVLELRVLYHPTDVGPDEGQIIISSNDPDGVTRVDLSSQYKGTVDINVSPDPLDFQTLVVGQTEAKRTLIVENLQNETEDNAVLRVNAVYLESESTTVFQIKGLTTPFWLGKSQQKEIEIVCHPPDAGEFTDRVIFESNDPDEAELAVDVTCTGVKPILGVETLGEGNLLDFGIQRVNYPTSVVLTVSNAGGGTLTIDPPSLVDGGSPYFSIDTSAWGEEAVNLDGGQYRELPVTYAPDVEGSHSAQIRISHSGRRDVFTINLAGQAKGADLLIDPNPVDFGALRVNQELSRGLTITNEGNTQVTLVSLALETPDNAVVFADDDILADVELGPDESHSITLTFSPEERGNFNNMVHITTDDSVFPSTDVPVNAVGIAPVLQVSEPENPAFTDTVDFGEVAINQRSEHTLRVTNAGDAAMTLTAIQITANTDSNEFTRENIALGNVPAGEFVEFAVYYDPVLFPGQDNGSLAISADDPATPQVVVNLTGLATDRRLAASPEAPLEFDDLHFGASDIERVTLRNPGFLGALTVTAASLLDGSSGFVLLHPTPEELPVILYPNSQNGLLVELRFTPTDPDPSEAEGPATDFFDTLRIVSDSYIGENFDYALEGTGTPCDPGCWDLDDNPDVCEYCNCYVTNDGVDICDDEDNDCDGLTDNRSRRHQQLHATR